MKYKVEYQAFGVYFSLLAKVQYQARLGRVWWAEQTCMTIIPNLGAYWREKCIHYTHSHNALVRNACADNKAVIRYYGSTRGLDRLQRAVKFDVGNFRSRHYTITQ